MLSATDIADRGRTLYQERIQGIVEARHRKEYLVVDIDICHGAVARDEEAALVKV